MSEKIERAMILNIITTFFGDPEKAELWMNTPNPLLGDISPDLMIKIGREDKLMKFIENAINENIFV